jgi:acid phosphatase family membrane protein YuiD
MTANMNPVLLFATPWFWASFVAWNLAQLVKMTTGFIKTGQIDFRYLLSTGGMPSAHSAMVSGLFTSIGLTEGFDAPVSMLAAGFAAITMFDAAGVRRAAGHQAKIMNVMIQEIFKQHKLSQMRLKELLGHTQKEVFAGMAVGIAVAVLLVHFWPHTLRTALCPASPCYQAAAEKAP